MKPIQHYIMKLEDNGLTDQDKADLLEFLKTKCELAESEDNNYISYHDVVEIIESERSPKMIPTAEKKLLTNLREKIRKLKKGEKIKNIIED